MKEEIFNKKNKKLFFFNIFNLILPVPEKRSWRAVL